MTKYFNDLPPSYRLPMWLLCGALAVGSWIVIPVLAACLWVARLFVKDDGKD